MGERLFGRKDVERARDAVATLLQDVHVLHGRAQLFVARKSLNGSDISPVLQQVRRNRPERGSRCKVEKVAQSKTTSSLRSGRKVWQVDHFSIFAALHC